MVTRILQSAACACALATLLCGCADEGCTAESQFFHSVSLADLVADPGTQVTVVYSICGLQPCTEYASLWPALSCVFGASLDAQERGCGEEFLFEIPVFPREFDEMWMVLESGGVERRVDLTRLWVKQSGCLGGEPVARWAVAEEAQ